MSYGYITKLSENVERQHIRYNNRYGTAIAADIYTPKNLEEDKLLPAIVIGTPYGSTKEQAAAIYENTFAQLGFVTLTFDQVYMGESAANLVMLLLQTYMRNLLVPQLIIQVQKQSMSISNK